MRKEFRIIVENSVRVEIYNEVVLSEDENKAIIEFLEDNIIYCGDTIRVEEE